MSDRVGLVTVFRAGARQKGNHTGACSGKALRTGERGWERRDLQGCEGCVKMYETTTDPGCGYCYWANPDLKFEKV